MNFSNDLFLDDILNRSLRLEAPQNFRIPLDFQNIKKSSQEYLSNYNDDREHIKTGILLLSGQKINDRQINVTRTPEILKEIDGSKMVQNEKLAFSEKCIEALKTSISESIEKSSKKDDIKADKFILSRLVFNMKERESFVNRFLLQSKSSVSGSKQYKEEKVELSQIVNFYKGYLFSDDFTHEIIGAIHNEQCFSSDVKKNLSNTFSIIDSITKEKSPILGSLRYLSYVMRKLIQNEVGNRPGDVGLIPTIRQYVELHKYPVKNPIWAVIYFALICGVQEELYQYLDENREYLSDDIKSAIVMFFKHLPLERTVANNLENYLGRNVTMKKVDPYETLVLCILTKRHIIPDSLQTIKFLEEWLWIRMQFIYQDSMNGQISSGLIQLQEEIKDFPSESTSNPFLPGQIFLLADMYQKAAEWFLSCDSNVDNCLHIVIAMRLANLIDDKPLIKPLLEYAKNIFRADLPLAIKYLSLLQESESRINAIARLAVEVKKGQMIFFSETNEYPPISMVIKYDEQMEIMKKAAHLAEYQDKNSKAIALYKLLDQYDSIIDIECNELRKYIEGFIGDKIINKSVKIFNEILSNNSPASPEKINAFRILLRFSKASFFYKNKEFRKAIDEIENSAFLPTRLADVEFFRGTLVANPEIRKALPKMIIFTIDSYAELYNQDNKNKDYREKAEAILELTCDIDLPNYAQKLLLDLSNKFQ